MSTASRLRELLRRPGIIRSLGAHDVFTAKVIEAAGLETVFIGGFGTSASLLGLPDVGFMTMTEMADAVRRMAAAVSIPVVADGDTGHGEVHNVVRTVREFERAGAAGILLEDQVTPKRCGHFQGKQLIAADDMVLKLRAALQARSDPDFVLVARTDARAVEGLEAAIERANRYGQTGADLCFIEAPQSRHELELLPERVRYPLLVNMLTGGVTPLLTADQLQKLGYKIAVFPIESLMVAGRAVQRLAQALMSTGRAQLAETEMMSFEQIKRLLGLDQVLELRQRLHPEGEGRRSGP